MWNLIFRKKKKSKRVFKKDPDIKYFTDEELKTLHDKARVIIDEKVKFYAPLIGVTYNRIFIRFQKTRWGSCSSLGNLNFNALLVLAPVETLEAIVVHELAHRKYMNHSKDFYNLIYSVMPDYKKREKWLKDNGRDLIKRLPK